MTRAFTGRQDRVHAKKSMAANEGMFRRDGGVKKKSGVDIDCVAPAWAAVRDDATADTFAPVMTIRRRVLFSILKAPCCTAMDWIFIPAYCFAIP